MALHDRVFQLDRAADRRVAREIVVDGRNGRVLDVLRRGEMRLAHGQVHHVHARLAQLVGLGDDGHGGGGLNAVDAFGEFQAAAARRGSSVTEYSSFPAFTYFFYFLFDPQACMPDPVCL